MARRTFITGITGQDGAYLAKWLLEKGHEVYGAFHKTHMDTWRLDALGIVDDIMGIPFDLCDFDDVRKKLESVRPDEIYNFAAYSSLASSATKPLATADINGLGPLRLLEAVRLINPQARIFQASSAELFGNTSDVPQTETTSLRPSGPYGIAKLFAHNMVQHYRQSHGIHASNGILFNHESPLRGTEFVTRKITKGLAAIKYQRQEHIELGNLDVQRDWGFAGDYVKAAHLMLQQPIADDYVLATGSTHTVREFIECAAQHIGLSLQWHGKGLHETGIDTRSGKTIIKINPNFYRLLETHVRVGQYTKALQRLQWAPDVKFEDLVHMMVEADLRNCCR